MTDTGVQASKKMATITLVIDVYDDRVECVAKGMRWYSKHGGKVIKTTPYASQYGPGSLHESWGHDKSLKQAVLEATEPQIDFSMEDLGLTELEESGA